MAKAGYELSDDELLEYSGEHVFHEINLFFQTGSIMMLGSNEPESAGRKLLTNLLVQSFAIHCRNLVNFFYPTKPPQHDDVVAAYFFPGKRFPPSFPAKASPTLEGARTRADKQVSHLTTRRIAGTPPEKRWPARELLSEFRDLLLEFVRQAAPDRLHAKIGDFVRAQPDRRTIIVRGNAMDTSCTSTSTSITGSFADWEELKALWMTK